jgi:sulfite reductase (NADPH) flavoprotein alpha-component
MRHPQNDFLYGQDLEGWHRAGHLTRLETAVSRGARASYVQDVLRAEASDVARLIRDGARVMVCGGRGMATGVSEALTDILAPLGLTPAALKAEGRYVEDVY